MLKLNKFDWIFLAIAFAFFLLKAVNIAPKISDENIYFYDAYLMTHGILPYKDFFLASLPGQLIPLAILIKLFGFNLFILKLMPIVASIGSSFLIYKMMTGQSTKDIVHRKIPGLISATLFLFSFSVLVTTDHGTGVHEAVFFLILSWYFLSRERIKNQYSKLYILNSILGGLSLFAGLTIRTYIVPAALGFCLFLLYQKRFKEVFLYGLAAFLPYIALNGIFYQLWHEKFYIPVWQYHLLKTEGIDKGKIFTYFLQNEWMLIVAFVIATFVILRNCKSKCQMSNVKSSQQVSPFLDFDIWILDLLGMAFFGLIAQCVFLFIYKDMYYLYLDLLIPFLAVIVGVGTPLRQGFEGRANSRTKYKFLVGGLGIFIVLNSYNYLINHAPTSVITNFDKIVADVRGLTTLNGSDTRIVNGETSNVTDTSFVADRLSTNSTMWGTFAIAPLVALESGNTITDNQIDTNIKRVSTGLWDAKEATKTALKSNIFIQLAYIDPRGPSTDSGSSDPGRILRLDPSYISQHEIEDHCTLFRTYPIAKDYDNNAILLWFCK